MNARLIPYTVPQLESNTPFIILRDIVKGEIDRQGDSIKKLEKSFADYVDTRYAVTFASARAALYYTYSFFSGKGERILLPSYTCIPAIDSARWAGLEPHFLDIELNSYNPRFTQDVRKIKNVDAVSLSYLYGLIGDLQPFMDYAKDRGIPIIEDAAIALGASYKGKKAGAIGDAGIFSLQESKTITSWRGGVVTTDNRNLYEYLKDVASRQKFPASGKLIFNLLFSYKRNLFSHPRMYGLTMYSLKKLMTTKKLAPVLGKIMSFNPLESIDGVSPEMMPKTDRLRLSNIQASVALQSMKHIDSIVKKRRTLAKHLSEELEGSVQVPQENGNANHAYGRFPIRVPGSNKFRLYNHFLKHGIETSINYPYICSRTKFMVKHGFKNKDYPNAIVASRETILLPFHTYLSEGDIYRIIEATREIGGG